MHQTEYYIIAGHGKTGSTYLQQCLSRSRSILGEQGIDYPYAPLEEYSGNGRELLFRHQFSTAAPIVLYCNEHICTHVADHPDLGQKLGLLNNPKVLLFIRDPLEHAVSKWLQDVKKGRNCEVGLSDFFDKYDTPSRMRRVIARLEDFGTEVTVRNYSKVRKDLVGEVEAWLGASDLHRCDLANRSLTESEAKVVRILAHWGLSVPLAKAFLQVLPSEVAPLTGPPVEVQLRLLERLSEDIDWINERVGDQFYGTDLLPVGEGCSICLKPEHIEAMVEVLLEREREAGPVRSAKALLRRTRQMVYERVIGRSL